MSPAKKDNSSKGLSIWPRDANPCIWMEAGIIEYKLCDREFACEDCPFHSSIAKGNATGAIQSKETADAAEQMQEDRLAEKTQPLLTSVLPKTQARRDSYYDDAFCYVTPKRPDYAEVGLTETGIGLLPEVNEFIFVSNGGYVARGAALCWILSGRRTLSIPSPINGVIANVNVEFSKQYRRPHPSHLWVAQLRVQNLDKELQRCLRGKEAQSFLNLQYASIRDLLFDYVPATVKKNLPTFQDGGELVGNLQKYFDDDSYFEFICKLFKRKGRSDHLG